MVNFNINKIFNKIIGLKKEYCEIKPDKSILFSKDCVELIKRHTGLKDNALIQSLKIEIDNPDDLPKIAMSVKIW